jgi:hypothetical protein
MCLSIVSPAKHPHAGTMPGHTRIFSDPRRARSEKQKNVVLQKPQRINPISRNRFSTSTCWHKLKLALQAALDQVFIFNLEMIPG